MIGFITFVHMIRVLFVCMGNICRSPLAEVIFQDLVRDAGLAGHFHIDSAGTGGWHEGERADARSIAIAAQNGHKLTSRARQIRPRDVVEHDYIVVMDKLNYTTVEQIKQNRGGGATIVLMRDYDPTPESGEVPDPYNLPDEAFEQVYQILRRSCQAFLDSLRQQHGLATIGS